MRTPWRRQPPAPADDSPSVSPYPEGPRTWSERHIHLIGDRARIEATTTGWEDEGWVIVAVRPVDPDHQGREVWEVHVAVPSHT